MKWIHPSDDNDDDCTNRNKNELIARVIEILIVVSLNHIKYMQSSQQKSSIINEHEHEMKSEFNFDHVSNDDSYEHEHEHEHEHELIGKGMKWKTHI